MPRVTPPARRAADPEEDAVSYETVNHPPHYTPDAIECIDALAVVLTPDEFRGFLRGTILKYQWRLGRKPNVEMLEDIQKCNWYAERLEAHVQNEVIEAI